MMTWRNVRASLAALILAALSSAPASTAFAERPNDGLSAKSYEALKGKKVVFLPISMSFDLTQAWAAAMEREADRLGYKITIRDPNWSIDESVQAMQAIIREKPDLVVLMPSDVTSLSRLVKKAQDEGVKMVEINQLTTTIPDMFTGADWYSIGYENGKKAVEVCGKDGRSNKIALITGLATAPATIDQVAGIKDALSGSNIQIVSTQAADWDASKSNAIAATVIKQNPDLCAIADAWDGQATGAAAAIEAAGLRGKMLLITEGGGESHSCKLVQDGVFDIYLSEDAAMQARDLNAVVKMMLQDESKPGTKHGALFSRNKFITKETMRSDSCWTVEDIRKNGG